MMELKEIPRTWVRSYVQLVRPPLTAAERVVKPAEPEVWPPAVAFDALEAGIKQFAGTVLRDNELVEEGRVKQAKVSAARRAVELEADAEQREQRDEQLREQVRQEADRREDELARQRAERQRKADEEARRKEQAAAKAEQAADKVIARQDRAARSTKVRAEREALAKEKTAAAAKSDVLALDAELEATKVVRKAD
jgi:hypothetical protein